MSPQPPHGGPAFPSQHIDSGCSPMQPADGMTLRDYFAAKAMAAMVGNVSTAADAAVVRVGIAEDAYLIADAMLAERAKAATP
jgi:hypothetical protein